MIELAYPPSILNPNNRTHWARKNSIAKAYKHDCLWRLKISRPERMMRFTVQFFPPDRRGRDRDNAIASFKYGQDALAQFWNVNDKDFEITYLPFGEPVKGGKVLICLA